MNFLQLFNKFVVLLKFSIGRACHPQLFIWSGGICICHVHTQVGYFSSFTVLLIICLPSGLRCVDGFVEDVVLVYESQIWHTKEYGHWYQGCTTFVPPNDTPINKMVFVATYMQEP
jgi:hypothetical protein